MILFLRTRARAIATIAIIIPMIDIICNVETLLDKLELTEDNELEIVDKLSFSVDNLLFSDSSRFLTWMWVVQVELNRQIASQLLSRYKYSLDS